jgi:hypothetical protein
MHRLRSTDTSLAEALATCASHRRVETVRIQVHLLRHPRPIYFHGPILRPIIAQHHVL